MATLKGLFEPRTRTRRNFLLENKREIKFKSILNSQKNESASNVPQKQRSSFNSLHTTPRPSSHIELSTSQHLKQKTKNPPFPELHAKPLKSSLNSTKSPGKARQHRQMLKPGNPASALRSISSVQTKNYIHQENVPFEWTEVCPSLISHTICHQGVQTDDSKCDGLIEQLRYLSSEDLNGKDCDDRDGGDCKILSSKRPNHRGNKPPPSNFETQNSVIGSAVDRTTSSGRDHREVKFGLREKNLRSYQDEEEISELHKINGDNILMHSDKEHANNSFSGKAMSMVHNSDHLKLSSSRKSAASNRASGDPLFCPPSYQKGVIPKYLSKRKTEEALASARVKEIDPNCPPGHVVMPDSERRETLDMILKNYNDLITELNKVPVRTDTLKMKQRKIEIEKQLDKLEEGIRVFSRSKVYVKLDA